MKFKRLILSFLLVFASSILHAAVIFTDINGTQTPWSALQGKWVMINYWASWCQPCLNEISQLNRFYRNNHHKVALFAVNYDAIPIDEQKQLIQQLHIRYPALSIDPRRMLNLGDIRGVPATFVFNPQGQLSTVLYGEQTLVSLERAIHKRSHSKHLL